MASRTGSPGEQPSTYFVQDRSNKKELARLQIQDQLMTAAMGGVLPEQPDPTIFQSVLDTACGTGGWLIEAAKTYPTMTKLVGIDISKKMVEYARTQVQSQQVKDRVEFQVMDALRTLGFPAAHFDLVNQRSGTGYLRTWDWPKLLSEFRRVTRRGGVIRITEADFGVESTSPALTRLNKLVFEAFYRAGHIFLHEKTEVTSELARLMKQHGVQDVQTRTCTLEYRPGTEEGDHFIEDMKLVFRTVVPFVQKWGNIPSDYEAIYQQAISEMQHPDFTATWPVLTAWGNR